MSRALRRTLLMVDRGRRLRPYLVLQAGPGIPRSMQGRALVTTWRTGRRKVASSRPKGRESLATNLSGSGLPCSSFRMAAAHFIRKCLVTIA